MTKKNILGSLGVALSLVIGFALAASFLPANTSMVRASPEELEWSEVSTPSGEGLVILPGSDIYDFAVAPDGDTIYAIGTLSDIAEGEDVPRLWKSVNGGQTWEDYTEEVLEAENLPTGFEFNEFSAVAVAPDDDDFIAVAGDSTGGPSPRVVISDDGGTTFYDTRDLTDDSVAPPTEVLWITCMAISAEVDDTRNIAVGGVSQAVGVISPLSGTVYRLEVDLESIFAPYWKDTTVALESRFTITGSTSSTLLARWNGSFVDGDDSPGENLDVNVTDWSRMPLGPPEEYTVSYTDTSGAQTTSLLIWDNLGTPAWAWTSVPSNVLDITNISGFGLGKYPGWFGCSWVTSIAFSPSFPDDGTILCMGYRFGDAFYLQSGEWSGGGGVWNEDAGFAPAVEITDAGRTIEPSFIAFLTLSGMTGIALPSDYLGSDPDMRVALVYVNGCTSLNRCGGFLFRVDNDQLSEGCGPPNNCYLASIAYHGTIDSGRAMVGLWSSICEFEACGPEPSGCCEGVQVYRATDLDCCCPEWEAACKPPSGQWLAQVAFSPDGDKAYAVTQGTGFSTDISTSFSDESAFSVSFDDGNSWNQLGLIDTDIDFISDLAVCPDCQTVYISTINNMEPWEYQGSEITQVCECDSVWRSWVDNNGAIGDTWERVYHGNFSDTPEGDIYDPANQDPILLRLPVDQTEDCCTVYLGDYGSDDLYYSRDCGQCWSKAPATKLTIQDIAVESENIVYVLDEDGYVSRSTDYGRRSTDGTDTGVGSGHTIIVMPDEMVLVGGMEGGEVAYSDDGGETFTLTDELPADASGEVHVAFDPICPDTIYAAVSGVGIYRTTTNSGAWDDLNAEPFDYYGIVLGRSDGTLYAPYVHENFGFESGVARNLEPCETDCCGEESWDYLVAGLTGDEHFYTEPSALRICGCLTIASNSLLWAIDFEHYDLAEGSDGTVWVYEDCVSKMGPNLLSPVDGTTIPCDTCDCQNTPLTLKWERLCVACSYDIEIMDEEGNVIAEWLDKTITGDPPEWYVEAGVIEQCGATYQWHVRVADAESGEWLYSPWSDTWSFTVAAGKTTGVRLTAPENGITGIPTTGVPFSWSSTSNATSYDLILSANSDLSSPIASAELTGTAYKYTGPLEHSMTYYWQVRSWKNGNILSTSDIGVFTTTPEPAVVTEPSAPPPTVLNLPPVQRITPTWIYAIIGIGAGLAAVVIVLIIRRRRRY